MPPVTFEDQLKAKFIQLLSDLQPDAATTAMNEALITNALSGVADPTAVSIRAAQYWTDFIGLANDNKDQIRSLPGPGGSILPQFAAAAAMQLMFTRLMIMWNELEVPGDGTLNPLLTARVNDQVPAFIELITT